ncbi:MAG: hypothetical protein ACOCWO_03785, partial [Candidatus Muiribacteriaceae bacterium]
NTVETIERLGDKEAFEKIIMLVNDPDSRVKANVAKFFKQHGYYETIDILKKMVYSGKRAQLLSAVYVLERMDKKGESLLKIAKEKLKKESRKQMVDDLRENIKKATGEVSPEVDDIKNKVFKGIKSIFKK